MPLSPIYINNADILFNQTDANLTFDGEELVVIKSWQLISRFIKYIQNRDGSVDKKVNKLVNETLEEINSYNQNLPNKYINNLFYLRKKGDSIFFDPIRMYSPHYPAYYLAEKVKNNAHFNKDTNILSACSNLENQKDLYPDYECRSRPFHQLLDPITDVYADRDIKDHKILEFDFDN